MAVLRTRVNTVKMAGRVDDRKIQSSDGIAESLNQPQQPHSSRGLVTGGTRTSPRVCQHGLSFLLLAAKHIANRSRCLSQDQRATAQGTQNYLGEELL